MEVIIKEVLEEIEESEEELKKLGTSYDEVMHNKCDLIDESRDNAQYSAGRLTILYELKKWFDSPSCPIVDESEL